MRFFLSKRGSLVNVRFSVFCPQWRLADLARFVSYRGSFFSVREYIVKPVLKDGSVVSFLLQLPVIACDSSDEARDTLMKDYGAFKWHLDTILRPEEVDVDDVVDNDDLPF